MTPPPAAAATVPTRRVTPRAPRRVSGPARRTARRGVARPAAAAAGAASAAQPLALRLGRVARTLPDAPVLDRLIRGRAWIGLVAVALMGIVFMQVSMLKLNAGISRAVAVQSSLDRQNTDLRAQVSRLESGERIQDVAAKLGMVDASAGEVRFVHARRPGDARRAASMITKPDPTLAQQADQAAADLAARTAPPAAATTPAATTPTATTTPTAAPTTATTTPATTTTTAAPPAQQQAAGTTAAPTTQQQAAAQQPAAVPAGGTAAPAGAGG